MKEIFEIKVTKIKNRWHARLIHIEKCEIIDEMACDSKDNISYICFTMLRWADKLGWISPMADAARHRQKQHLHDGKVWYRGELHNRESNG